MNKKQKKLLIIGANGGLSRITTKLLFKYFPGISIVAIDSRPITVKPYHPQLEIIQMKYRRGEFENLFRTHNFDYVIFLSRVTHSSISTNLLKKRLSLTLQGTDTILELCLKQKVSRVIILSTFHVYGALNDNPVFLYEDAPLKASLRHADLRDVVEMDQRCYSWMLEHKNDIDTLLLRPTNIIGPSLKNGITNYLTHPMAFYPLDFNPMIQFVHEYDMANVLAHSIDKLSPGLYNIADPGYLPLKNAVKIVNPNAYPLPIFPLEKINKLLNKAVAGVPNYLVDYLKYPCLISNKKFIKVMGEEFFKFSTETALESLLIRNLPYLAATESPSQKV